MSSGYMSEMFYGKPEPEWMIDNRRRGMGQGMGGVSDPYYQSGSYSGYGSGRDATSMVPEVTIRTPLMDMNDVARIKNALSVQGVYNVVCDIPAQSVRVSSSLSPRTVVELLRRAMGSATVVNYVDPMQPTFRSARDSMRYSSYDDSYSYDGRTGYNPTYNAPYNGRSYDNEFRPSSYGGRSSYGSRLY